MDVQQAQNPLDLVNKYFNMLLRRKWIVIFGAVPILAAAIFYCLITPKVFKTSTTIIVVAQRVPESFVRTTVTGDISQRIRAIMQQITSRTNLEKVIQEFNLYPDERASMPMEKVVALMRNKIDVDIPRTREINSFTLAYEGKNPVLIAEVLNYLANMFIEENLKLREKQAMNTANFLNAELNKIYQKLTARENALKQYKMEHMGELPEQLPSNNAMLERLQTEYETLQENLRRAEDRKLMLSRQMRIGIEDADTSAGQLSTPTTLSALKGRLKILRGRYTEKHPDIAALKERIAKMEEAQKQQADENNRVSAAVRDQERSVLDSEVAFQLRSIETEIKNMKLDSANIRKQISMYKERIENTPKREQELLDLTRDYDNLRQTYDSLMSRKIQADEAAALERRQQGEQFHVVDAARVPEVPIRPTVKKILLMALVLSFGAGVGAAIGIDFIRQNFYDPDDVEKAFGIPVITCIPQLLTDMEKKRRRLKEIILGVAAAAAYSGIGGLLFFLIKNGAGALVNL